MKKNRAHWAKFEPGNPAHLVCTRCQAREVVELPKSVTKFCKQTDAFVRVHSQCTEPPLAASQDG